MSRLFVVHTQYNLILATGMADKDDDLILFRDFALTDELRLRLEGCFSRCLFLAGNYPKKELSVSQKDIKINSDCKAIKAFINNVYDQIFIVDDMCIQEMYALKQTYKYNKNIEMSWLEDGSNAYFSNNVISTGMGSTSLKRFIRKLYFSFKYNLFNFYDLGICMGAHKSLKSIYLTFPDCTRKELTDKKRMTITNEQFRSGLNIMFAGKPIQMENNSVIIAVDKLDVYGDKLPSVNREIERIIEKATIERKKVYCKYHPRETQKMDALLSTEELNSKIAMEYYLANSTAKNMTIVGVTSTALQTAKKLGYDVISLASIVGISDDVITFYKSIGIEII